MKLLSLDRFISYFLRDLFLIFKGEFHIVMLNRTSLYLSLIILSLLNQSLNAESTTDLIRDEDYIPFYAELQKEIVTEVGSLRSGERVVVLRPIDDDRIRVDVSRKGTASLPLDATNLAAEIKRAKHTDDPNIKLVPRMSFFLANRVVSGGSGWQNPIPGEMVYAAKRWILLYGDAEVDSTKVAVAAASEFYNTLPDHVRKQTVFVYMDVYGKKAAIQNLAEQLKPSIHCMPGYLSRGYSKSLDHINNDLEFPQLVEVASSGRILDQISGTEEITNWLIKN